MSERGLASTVVKFETVNVTKFGIAMPRGRTVVPLLSRLSPLTRTVKTIGAMIGRAKGLVNCGASKDKCMGNLLGRGRSVGSGGILVIKTNKTTETVCFAVTGRNPRLLSVYGQAPGETRRVVGSYPFHIPTQILDEPSTRKDLRACSLVIRAASVKVRPRVNRDPLSMRGLGPKTFIDSVVCGPLRAGLLARTTRGNTKVRGKVSVFMCRNTLTFRV